MRTRPVLREFPKDGGILKEGSPGNGNADEAEIQINMRAVAHAIAQQELEGLKVSDATIADLHRAARGEIAVDEVSRNIFSRLPNAPLLRQ